MAVGTIVSGGSIGVVVAVGNGVWVAVGIAVDVPVGVPVGTFVEV